MNPTNKHGEKKKRKERKKEQKSKVKQKQIKRFMYIKNNYKKSKQNDKYLENNEFKK